MPRPPAGDACAPQLGQPRPVPPLSRTRGAHHRGQVLWQERPGTPLLLLVVVSRGDPERVLGITPTHLYGAAPIPRPPLPAPAALDGVLTFLRTQDVIAVTGVHLVQLPPAPPDDPEGPSVLSPATDWELWRDAWAAWLPCLSPNADGWPRAPARTGLTPPPAPHPLFPSPRGALHSTAHGTTQMHREVVERAHLPPRMPTRITVMSDSDGSPQRYDRHYRRSRSRSLVSAEGAGETPAEREERRLAEAAVPVGPPAGRPRAAPADTGPSTQGPGPAEETAPATQAASPAAPPWEAAPGARGAETAAPASRAAAPTAAPGAPPARRVAPAQDPGASPGAVAAAGGAGRLHGGLRPRPWRARPPPRPATPRPPARRRRGGRTPRGPRAPRGGPPQQQQWAGRARSTARTPTPPTPTQAPPSRSPPSPSPWGGRGTFAPPAPERLPPGVTLPQLQRQRDARRVIQEGGDGAQAGQSASHGSAERGTGGDRGSAQGHAQGAGQGTRGKEQGHKHGRGAEASSSGGGQSAGSGRRDAGQGAGKGPGHCKGAQGRGQGAQAGTHGAQGAERGTVGERGRSQGHGHGHGTGMGAGRAGQGVGDRGRDPRQGQGDRGVGTGRRPKGKGKGAAGRGQTGRGMGARGGGWGKGRGPGGGAPPQPDVQPVRCIPPGIQQMPAHHTHHHHHHHANLYNIDPDAGELIPPQPPRPQHQQAPPAPRAGPARIASVGGGGGAAPALQAQGPQREPAQGAGGARPWDRDWGTVPDPLGNEALPLVVGVYGWLSWASSGTTREMRNQPFDAVLLRRDRGN